MVHRRRFLTSAAGATAASIVPGCARFSGDEAAVTTGRVDVDGSRASVTATVESLGPYDELEAGFEHRVAGGDWRTVDADPGTVDAPTELTGVIDGLDETEEYEWTASLWNDGETVATGDVRSFTAGEAPSPPSADASGLVAMDYDAYSETGDLYAHWLDEYSGTPDRHRWTDDPAGSGETVLEVPFGEGVDHAGNAALALDHPDLGIDTNEHGRTERVYQRFQLYLQPEFQLPADDTLRFCYAAMSFSSGDAHSGGGRPDGTNGWSSRPYFTRREAVDGTPAPDDGWHVGGYTYHMDQSSPEAGDTAVFGDVVVSAGEWMTVETEVVSNTWSGSSANADGVVRCWIDGEMAYEQGGFSWATDASNLVEFCGFTGYYWPGSEGSPTEQSIYFKDHAVSTVPRDGILERS